MTNFPRAWNQRRIGSTFFGVGILGAPGITSRPLDREGVCGVLRDPREPGVLFDAEYRLCSRSLPFLPDFVIDAGGAPIARDSVQGSSNCAFIA